MDPCRYGQKNAAIAGGGKSHILEETDSLYRGLLTM